LHVSTSGRKLDVSEPGHGEIVFNKPEATNFYIPLCRFSALLLKWAFYCISSWPSPFKVVCFEYSKMGGTNNVDIF
jgi:hypothetical protein